MGYPERSLPVLHVQLQRDPICGLFRSHDYSLFWMNLNK